MHQQNKYFESKVTFRQASNYCKNVLEAAKVHVLIKQKIPLLPRNLAPLFNGQEVLSSASGKAKLLSKNFSKNSNLDNSGTSLPVFPSRTNLKLHNISVTPKMVKKVITNLDLLKVSGPDCIRVVVL